MFLSSVVIVEFTPPFAVNIAEDGGSVSLCATLIRGMLDVAETATVFFTINDGTAERKNMSHPFSIVLLSLYSGTSLIRTLLLIVRCPDFKGCNVHKQGAF